NAVRISICVLNGSDSGINRIWKRRNLEAALSFSDRREPEHRLDNWRKPGFSITGRLSGIEILEAAAMKEVPLLAAVTAVEVGWRIDGDQDLAAQQGSDDRRIPFVSELNAAILIEESYLGTFRIAEAFTDLFGQVFEELAEVVVVVGARVTQKELIRHVCLSVLWFDSEQLLRRNVHELGSAVLSTADEVHGAARSVSLVLAVPERD